eukprot:12361547-Alexandrium_andersonii.AAC.1
MSASLVGSEMCIRDSASAARQQPAVRQKRRQSAARHAAAPQRSHCCGAVSYTHLTLPTICSV